MKAAQRFAYGGSEVITINEIPIPEPTKNQIRVKVMATTVNRTDCALLTAKPIIMRAITGIISPKTPGLGTDFAGVIDTMGSGVDNFKVGDRVWGFYDNGIESQAEFVCINADKPLMTLPESVDLNQAVASIEGAHYALNFLRLIKIQKEMHILVNGGTGAIGSALIQLLHLEGCAVTATCRAAHAEIVKKLGAKTIIDYETDDFTQSSQQFDCVLDAVGKSTFGKCRRIIKPNGIYISSEPGPWMQNPFLTIITACGNGKKVKFPIPINVSNSLHVMGKLLASQQYKPLIQDSYALDNIADAYALALSGQKVGSILIKMPD